MEKSLQFFKSPSSEVVKFLCLKKFHDRNSDVVVTASEYLQVKTIVYYILLYPKSENK